MAWTAFRATHAQAFAHRKLCRLHHFNAHLAPLYKRVADHVQDLDERAAALDAAMEWE